MMTSMEGFNILAKEVLPKIISRIVTLEEKTADPQPCVMNDLPEELTVLPMKFAQLSAAHGSVFAELERLNAEVESLRGLLCSCESKLEVLANGKSRPPRKRKVEEPVAPVELGEETPAEEIVIPEPIEQEVPAPEHEELPPLPTSNPVIPPTTGSFTPDEIEQVKAFYKVGLSIDMIATQLGKSLDAVETVVSEWKAKGVI